MAFAVACGAARGASAIVAPTMVPPCAIPIDAAHRLPPSPPELNLRIPSRRDIDPWSRRWRSVLLLLVALASFAALGAAPPASEMNGTLAAARRQMDELQQQLSSGATQESLAASRSDAMVLQSRAAEVATALAPEIANLRARLDGLGTAPTDGQADAPDVAAQRTSLAEQLTQLDAQLRLARLLVVEGTQAVEQIDKLRRSRFRAQIGERTTALLGAGFWTELRAAWPGSAQRLLGLAQEVGAAARAGPVWRWLLAIGAAGALLALVRPLLRRLRDVVATRAPHGRLRRSLFALGRTLLPPVAALLALQCLRWGFGSAARLPAAVDALLGGSVAALTFGTYVAALGHALMSPRSPSWRLPALPDLLASRLGNGPLQLGVMIAAGAILKRAATLAEVDLEAEVAIDALIALLLGLLLLRVLRRGERLRRELPAAPQDAALPPRPLPLLTVAVLGWAALVLSLACLLTGYVALGSLIVYQVAWVIVVGATTYLLAAFIDDACTSWLGAPPAEAAPTEPASLKRRQAGVLVSAAGRIVLGLAAISLLVGSFSQAPVELFSRVGGLRDGVTIGSVRLLPGDLVHALVVLALGVTAVRLMQRWLLQRFLPTTGLDEGMRSSMATLLGFAGLVVVVSLALSALGLGLERVAWVASALSVGIGFGLQAVVQNFVSGLILLTERPVKVGDWVSLGGVEGDIRRINVRATEIQTGDRSTVIVPNSEFITKVVRNVTHQNPLGLVQIKLPLPADCDAEQVRALILDALRANGDVLDAPAPNVLLDSVDGNNLIFNATGSVASPRQTGSVRSALLFDILARLKAQGLSVGRPPTLVLREAAAPAEAARQPGGTSDAGA